MSTWLVVLLGRVSPLLWAADITVALAGLALRMVIILTGLSVAATFCAAVRAGRPVRGIPEQDAVMLIAALDRSLHEKGDPNPVPVPQSLRRTG